MTLTRFRRNSRASAVGEQEGRPPLTSSSPLNFSFTFVLASLEFCHQISSSHLDFARPRTENSQPEKSVTMVSDLAIFSMHFGRMGWENRRAIATDWRCAGL